MKGFKLNKNDFIGKRFGRWVVQPEFERRNNNKPYFKCICDCGTIKFVALASLISGKSKSCECLRLGLQAIRNRIHGLRGHPLYDTYNNIRHRCYDIKNPSYPRYGGKGVVMCEEWLSDFKAFYDWCIANGWEKGLEIDKDKIAMELGVPANIYSPERCQILTQRENNNYKSNSTRIEYKGESKSLSDWSIVTGISRMLLKHRIKKWGIERAFNTPVLKTHTRVIKWGIKIANENIFNAESFLKPKRSVVYNRNLSNAEKYFALQR